MKQLSQRDTAGAAKILKDGGVIAVPTETVYGLAAALDSEKAIKKLLEIKERPVGSGKICSLMLPSVTSIRDFAKVSNLEYNLALRYFPGELTMIFNKQANFKNSYFDNFDTIGIRIPAHKYMLSLLKKTGPLLVTSANPRGESACCSDSEVRKRLPKIDSVVRGKAGNSLPSTILDIRNGEPKILRQGGLLIVHY